MSECDPSIACSRAESMIWERSQAPPENKETVRHWSQKLIGNSVDANPCVAAQRAHQHIANPRVAAHRADDDVRAWSPIGAWRRIARIMISALAGETTSRDGADGGGSLRICCFAILMNESVSGHIRSPPHYCLLIFTPAAQRAKKCRYELFYDN